MTRAPAKGLGPRPCEVCGTGFQPYRDNSTTCSRTCYKRTDRVKKREQGHKSQPEVKERKNYLRRVDTNPLRREVNRRNNLRKYGVTPELYDEMVLAQGNRCAVCGNEPDPRGVKASSRLHVDHDHVTGAVRELLCTRCNQGVGYFRDDPALLRAMADYIERHRKVQS